MDSAASIVHDGMFVELAQKMLQPLLLFFYVGLFIPVLKVPYEFPQPVYQGLTLYLLLAIGWHGGEELSRMTGNQFAEAAGFMVIGFFVNMLIGIAAYFALRAMTRMRQIDAATVGGYYGSDSAGTFMTCVGVLIVMGYKSFGFMPVMLAIMEMPGCLVALYLVSGLRRQGMDSKGNMPHESGYSGSANDGRPIAEAGNSTAGLDRRILHEVFFNPGLYFLFAGTLVGFISGSLFIRHDKANVISSENLLFVTLMHGVLCLFLLEMGITASKRLKDVKDAGWGFITFGILAPNVFACFGMAVAHGYSLALGNPFPLPTYALFAVLCAAASYIAVPAVQRMAIPEASTTLPLAASLGLTFTWNVTLGIPIYIAIAEFLMHEFPVTS